MKAFVQKTLRLFPLIVLWIWRRPRRVLIFSILIWVLGVAGLSRAKFELDLYETLDPAFPSSVDFWDLRRSFQDTNGLVLVLRSSEAIQAGEACRFLEGLRALVNRSPDATGLVTPWSLRWPHSEAGRVSYPPLLPDPCAKDPQSSILQDLVRHEEFPFSHVFGSPKDNELLVFVGFRDVTDAQGQMHFPMSSVESFLREFQHLASFGGREARLELLGPAAFRYYFKKIIEDDARWNFALVILIFVFMRLFYGTWRIGFLYFLTLIWSLPLTLGLGAWFGTPFDSLTNTLVLLIILACTADYIFFCENHRHRNLFRAFVSLASASFLTSLTTFIGFISLVVSDFEMIRRFGVVAAAGAMIEWFALFCLLPALGALGSPNSRWVAKAQGQDWLWLQKLQGIRVPRAMAWAVVGLAFLGLPAVSFLKFGDEPIRNFPLSHPLRQAAESMRIEKGWEGQVTLYFPQATAEAEVNQITKDLSSRPEVAFVESPLELRGAFSQSEDPTRQALLARDFELSPLWKKDVLPDGRLRASVYLKTWTLESLRSLNAATDEICRGRCRLAGQSLVYLEASEKISATLVESFMSSFSLVFLTLGILAWVYYPSSFLALILSAAAGPFLLVLGLAIFQVPLSLVTSVFLAVIVGLTGDSGIQFLLHGREQIGRGVDRFARASALIAVLFSLGSAFFLGMTLIPMKILGVLFIVGFLVNFACDVAVLRGLLPKERS